MRLPFDRFGTEIEYPQAASYFSHKFGLQEACQLCAYCFAGKSAACERLPPQRQSIAVSDPKLPAKVEISLFHAPEIVGMAVA